MTPSELLTAAADRIRDLAAAASTDEPWTYGGYGDFGPYIAGLPSAPEFEDNEQGRADLAWVAALSPAVAPALEAILRQAAFAYGLGGDNTQDENALGLARLVCPELAREDT